MHRLLETVILPAFDNPWLRQRHDGAILQLGDVRLAFTTDSYVVQPRTFSGGDIGSLAVHGTVNDLAMCGARPLYLSAGFILEEGLTTAELKGLVASMRAAADEAGVTFVTGDTKVVDRGHGDGFFVNTSGIGLVDHELAIGPESVREGDAVLVSGDLGRHGIAILAEREGLEFESAIESDSAPLHEVVLALLEAGIEVHCLRDLTRGGLATALVEVARDSGLAMEISESAIPVSSEVRGACEMLGLDPLYVANEGRFVAIVPGEQADEALAIMRKFTPAAQSVRAGHVASNTGQARVLLESTLGTKRVMDMLPGEQLPRIC